MRRNGLAVTTCAVLVLAGCGGTDSPATMSPTGAGSPGSGSPATSPSGPVAVLQQLGAGEGQLNLIAWAGYVENGSTNPTVDWVSDFTRATGCRVNVTIGNTSDEMVTLMRQGGYDGLSASGDATLRLIANGDVAPVNVDLIPNYRDVFPGLKGRAHNTVKGIPYGVPHARRANLLMWRTDTVKPEPNSWSVVWDANSPYKGKVTAYDSPMYIADAAVYLMATRPELGIKNPYELDDGQFTAAVDLLRTQRTIVGEYWSDFTKQQAAFTGKHSVVGTTWQVIANLLEADQVPVKAILPKEGSTASSDTWMIASRAEHPNCMYMWMNHIISPKVNAAVAEWFGEAPSNAKACAETQVRDHCTIYHAKDEEYFSRVYYWTTPQKECGDARGPICKDYSEWVQAWTEIRA
jgi:putative spermidine/putrescine transport system substrate-binding protein